MIDTYKTVIYFYYLAGYLVKIRYIGINYRAVLK